MGKFKLLELVICIFIVALVVVISINQLSNLLDRVSELKGIINDYYNIS